MSKQLVFFILALTLIFAFFYSVSDILLPFVLGILTAYFLDPIADNIQRKGVNRTASAGIITILFFVIVGTLGFFSIPILYHQFEGLLEKSPQYYAQFNSEILPLIKEKLSRIDKDIVKGFDKQASSIPTDVGAIVGGLFASSMKFLNLLSLLLITPVVTFYILRDWDKFIARVDNLLPRHYAPTVRKLAKRVDSKISAFIRGQLNVCLILGVYYGIGLTIVGLDFGFVIGLLTGFLTFIPYIGPITGAAIGFGVGYFQFGDDMNQLGLIAAVFILGQVAEGNFITPKLVGGRIGVHPAWLIFGMLAGGSLIGFVGVIISVPLTAVISVLVKFAIDEYEKSEFYTRPKAPRKKAIKKTEKKA